LIIAFLVAGIPLAVICRRELAGDIDDEPNNEE
jgi:hypothetical protein